MIGKYLIFIGAVIVVIGVLLLLAPKASFLGKLPGDIHFKKDNFTFYFPVTTSIVISIILSLVLWLLSRR